MKIASTTLRSLRCFIVRGRALKNALSPRERIPISPSLDLLVVSVRSQEVSQLPEGEAYEFRLFSGEVIKLEMDGSHFLDGKLCKGESFMGIENC